MAYTEFYCQSGGSNFNAGSTTSNASSHTYALGTWDSTTRVFTVASGDPVADGVAVGDFASVYTNVASATGYVARVTARTTTTITLSTTSTGGSLVSSGTNTRTLKIGGAWKGPNANETVPGAIINGALTNVAGDPVRLNMKNDADYSMTNTATFNQAGPMTIQGYSSSPGDGGKFTVKETSAGPSIVLLTVSGANVILRDVIVDGTNGTSGTQNGLNFTSSEGILMNAVVFGCRGAGLNQGNGNQLIKDVEVYDCNTSDTNERGNIVWTGDALFVRVISHHGGTGSSGFYSITNTNRATFLHCIGHANGESGWRTIGTTSDIVLMYCDAYDNAEDGIRLDNTSTVNVHLQNCNFVGNGGWGIFGNNIAFVLTMENCGFGSGTMANASGTYGGAIVANPITSGEVTYTANTTPWADPDDGNFSITSDEAKNLENTFLQTQSGYGDPNPTKSFTQIGAGPAEDVAGGGGETSFVG